MRETVHILERKFGWFPACLRFERSGRVVAVDAVERCWTEMKNRRRRARYHFQVRCGGVRYHLCQDGESPRGVAWPIGP